MSTPPRWRFVHETLLPEVPLTERRRAQLAALDAMYFQPAAEVSVLRILEERRGEPFWVDRTSLWQLKDGDELVYEVFMYGGDSGTAFKAGTTEVVAEIVQRRLQPHDDDAGLAIAIACEESDFRAVRNFTLRDAWSWYPPQKE